MHTFLTVNALDALGVFISCDCPGVAMYFLNNILCYFRFIDVQQCQILANCSMFV